ncbi:MAG: hypothetical protein KBF26_01345 [Opitutaceae bacterium]|nr:hypothetical protein [Opitutaceae bacterium]
MNVFIPGDRKAGGIYYVYFRYLRDGKEEQFFRSTREKELELAKQRAAAMFAAEIRRPDDTKVDTKLDHLSAQLAELRERLDQTHQVPAVLASGDAPARPQIFRS